MKSSFIKVTAHLGSPLLGDLPFLDSIIEFEMAQRESKAYKIRRHEPIPEYGEIHIPILRVRIGNVLVPCCSAPITTTLHETVEHFTKRFPAEHADLLSDDQRKIVSMSSGALKSYRIPNRARSFDKITWFMVAKRRPILSLLRSVNSLGHKRSVGYGIVRGWTAERVEEDFSWFATHPHGLLLMRPLPWCDELPKTLVGYRRDFGAVQPPMWHPNRYMERVIPC